MPAAAALELRGLHQRIGARLVLIGIDLTLAAGRSLTLFGPNGAGKSTLLRVAAGLMPPTRGQIFWHGRDVAEEGASLRAQVGFLAHGSFLYDGLTARENLEFYAQLYGVPRAAERIAELLDEVGLTLFAHEPVRGFSRGMVQRLAIARAILHDPPLLFLDEPFTGLDPVATSILEGVLDRYKAAGRTVVMVSHNFAEGLANADEVAVIARGRLIHRQHARGLTPAAWGEQYRALVGTGTAAGG